MVLLMETAAVLDSRAGRATDPTQAAVLRRRAEQRLREAESIRALLAADGAAISSRRGEEQTPTRRGAFSAPTSAGRRAGT
jgi:hypothetical protein